MKCYVDSVGETALFTGDVLNFPPAPGQSSDTTITKLPSKSEEQLKRESTGGGSWLPDFGIGDAVREIGKGVATGTEKLYGTLGTTILITGIVLVGYYIFTRERARRL